MRNYKRQYTCTFKYLHYITKATIYVRFYKGSNKDVDITLNAHDTFLEAVSVFVFK